AIFQVCGGQAKNEFLNAVQRILSSSESFKGKAQLLAVANGNEQVTDFEWIVTFLKQVAQRKEIAFGFGHLFAFDKQMLPMNPEANELPARYSLALGDLVLVMRKNIVDASTMNIQRFAEMLHRHSRTL